MKIDHIYINRVRTNVETILTKVGLKLALSQRQMYKNQPQMYK